MVKSTNLPRSQTSAGSSSENSTTDGVFSGKGGSDDPHSSDSETESNSSFDSRTDSNRSTNSSILSAIIRVLSDSMLRTEFAEMEMIKAREAARWEAENRRLEMEMELTQMVLQTHLQAMASLVVGEHTSSTTRENSLAFLGLLQLNLIFWNSLT